MRKGKTAQTVRMAAGYLDTPDRRLARAGLSWRLRREGRRWVQTLKGPGAHGLERFEHSVPRARADWDPVAHIETPPGAQLMRLIDGALEEGVAVAVRYRTDVRRMLRLVRTRGADVEVAYDVGSITAGDQKIDLHEIEFELVRGSPAAMLAMAERWRHRFGLVVDPRTKAEQGDRLAEGDRFPAVRKAQRVRFDGDTDTLTAFRSALEDCLQQILRNAIGLVDGDDARRVDHVHQLRVGVRRLRSLLRSYQGWVPEPPEALVTALRELFNALGIARDSDVMASGVGRELFAAGSPAAATPAQAADGSDAAAAMRPSGAAGRTKAGNQTRADGAPSSSIQPAELVASEAVQQALLGWISWNTLLAVEPEAASSETANESGRNDEPQPVDGAPKAEASALPIAQRAAGRLKRWHKRIATDAPRFEQLEEEAVHDLRKRVKRQRYALEFFAPLLRRKEVEAYLKPLSAAQEEMGLLNDLFVAQVAFREQIDQARVSGQSGAADDWFALGWLAARIREERHQMAPALLKLAKAHAPSA